MKVGRRTSDGTATSGAFAILPGRTLTSSRPAAGARHIDLTGPWLMTEPDTGPTHDTRQDTTAGLPPFLMDDATDGIGAPQRQLVAAEVLWQALIASSGHWRRNVALGAGVAPFFNDSARLVVAIADSDRPSSVCYAATVDVDGNRWIEIPIADVEQRCATIVRWLL